MTIHEDAKAGQAHEAKRKASSPAPGAAVDKKLNGPNRPAT
ncbi:hypothetical protein [Paenibacillus sp. y28]